MLESTLTVTPTETYVGVDVAKDTVEVFIASTGRRLTLADPARLVAVLKDVGPCRVVMEATGGYERRWSAALLDADIEVAVVNPKRVRDFAKALKPATYAFELRQRLGDGPVGNARLASHGDGRKGILHIVYAREIELHRQRLHLCA